VRPSEMFQKPSWKRPAFEQVLEFLEESKVAWREEREREAAKERKLLLAQEREARAHELARIQEEKLEQAQELVRAREEKLAQAQELAESRRRWFLWLAAMLVVAVVFA